MIYLDNAATTYPKPDEVLGALDNANRNAFNSGRGSYKYAANLTKIIDETRKLLLEVGNCRGDVIFTSSATQALNDLIFNVDIKEGDNIYISPFEHNSIIRALEELKRIKKINIIIIPFDKKTWEVDFNKLKNQFIINKPKCILLSHVSNVTGFILPFEKIFELSSEYNCINILDASQSFGVVNINSKENINYIVFAGHKSLYASFGIAGFIKLKKDPLNKFIFGGNGSDTMNPKMPDSGYQAYEAGSLNVVAICGLNASLKWLKKHNVFEHEKKMTDYLIDELRKIRHIRVFVPNDVENIFGVISFSIDGYTSDEVGKILSDEFDICVRTGFHCAPLVHDFIGSLESNGTVRTSLSFFTKKEEIDKLIIALKSLL